MGGNPAVLQCGPSLESLGASEIKAFAKLRSLGGLGRALQPTPPDITQSRLPAADSAGFADSADQALQTLQTGPCSAGEPRGLCRRNAAPCALLAGGISQAARGPLLVGFFGTILFPVLVAQNDALAQTGLLDSAEAVAGFLGAPVFLGIILYLLKAGGG